MPTIERVERQNLKTQNVSLECVHLRRKCNTKNKKYQYVQRKLGLLPQHLKATMQQSVSTTSLTLINDYFSQILFYFMFYFISFSCNKILKNNLAIHFDYSETLILLSIELDFTKEEIRILYVYRRTYEHFLRKHNLKLSRCMNVCFRAQFRCLL